MHQNEETLCMTATTPTNDRWKQPFSTWSTILLHKSKKVYWYVYTVFIYIYTLYCPKITIFPQLSFHTHTSVFSTGTNWCEPGNWPELAGSPSGRTNDTCRELLSSAPLRLGPNILPFEKNKQRMMKWWRSPSFCLSFVQVQILELMRLSNLISDVIHAWAVLHVRLWLRGCHPLGLKAGRQGFGPWHILQICKGDSSKDQRHLSDMYHEILVGVNTKQGTLRVIENSLHHSKYYPKPNWMRIGVTIIKSPCQILSRY